MFLRRALIDIPNGIGLSLYEILKVIYILGFVKVNQLVLDLFQKSKICFPVKGLIVVVKESRDLVEANEELGGHVIVFHDQLFKFNFGISDLVICAKIDHEFFYKFIIVVKPGGFLVWVVRQVRLKVIKSRSIQEGKSVVDLVRVRPE